MPRIDDQAKQQRAERIWLTVKANPRGIKESEIAQELNMGRRTVNNYLRDLEYEGKVFKDGRLWFPLNLRGMRLHSFELSPEEAVTLYLGARLLAKQHDKRNEPAETALLKLAQVLKSDAGVGDEIEQAARELAQRPVKEGYHPIFREIVRGYIYRKRVKLKYKPLGWKRGFETSFATYLLEPSSIGFSTYLIGDSRIVDDLRAYKLERIASAHLTNEDYDIPADFPGLDILRNAWSIITGDDTIDVVLRFAPGIATERVLETRWHPSEKTEPDPDKPGWLRWSAQVADTKDMLPWIRGWGADVEVVGPEGLRASIKSHVYSLAQTYHLRTKTENINTRLLCLWGKTAKESDSVFHPALYHMLDVAHVAQQLLSSRATRRWRQVLARTLNVNPDSLHEWLPWFIALHDIGKISVPFQAQNADQKQRLEKEKFDFGNHSADHKKLHHTIMGRMVLKEWAKQYPRNWRTVFLEMVSGHHGKYQQPGTPDKQLRATLREPEEWNALRQQAITILQNCLLLNEPLSWPEPENISAAIVALNGFTILCDWLGSDETYFTPKPHTPILEYISISRQKAKERVKSAGFFVPAISDAPTAFTDLFGWQPRPLQEAIDNIPNRLLTEPTLTIIEAPTGEGKTEAALTLAHRIAQAQGTDEMYIALPTTATSNAMYKRLKEHLRDRLLLPSNLVQLVHGQAFLMKDDLHLEPMDNGDGEPHPALTWFEPKKKSLLAPFGVGTVDQAELAALNVKHNALRLIGLAGKVVILDEVHAYDTYMTTIIARMLEWLSALGTSVVLLSATLPIAKRRQLAKAYTGGNVILEKSEAYPSVLTVNSAEFHAASPRAENENKIIYLHTLTKFAEADWSGKAKWLLKQVEKGGCVCWITNTVERAQRTFQALLELVPDDVDCTLLHARFPLTARQEIEEQISDKYGKKATKRPPKGIVIGTQVLEQSLDIDFDLMVSDLAPIDLLLQRIGRLHRHNRADRPHPEPHIYINSELDETGQLRIGKDRFYTPYLLLKTWRVIAQKATQPGYFDLPDDYRPLIEEVYDETPPAKDSLLFRKWKKREERESKLEGEADIRLTKEPNPRRPFCRHDGLTFKEDEESANWMVAQTRYQERETITVIPMEKIDEENGRLPQSSTLISLTHPADRQIQLDLLQQSVRISRPEIVNALKAAERPVLFTASALLKRSYPLWLEDNSIQIDKFVVYLEPQLGIFIEKQGA